MLSSIPPPSAQIDFLTDPIPSLGSPIPSNNESPVPFGTIPTFATQPMPSELSTLSNTIISAKQELIDVSESTRSFSQSTQEIKSRKAALETELSLIQMQHQEALKQMTDLKGVHDQESRILADIEATLNKERAVRI